MGCCVSTASPYDDPPNNGNNSSSRAINTSQPGIRPPTNASNHSGPSPHSNPHPHQQRPQRDLTKHPTKDLVPHVWASQKRTWTRSQIDKERNDFFDTRTSGRPEIWQAIRLALEVLWAGGDPEDDGGLATAQVMLKAAGVTVPHGDMTRAVYDGFGARYDLPEVIVSDPTNIVEFPTKSDEDDEDKDEDEDDESRERREDIRRGKAVLNPADMIDIRVRMTDRGETPLVVNINRTDLVRTVTKKIYEESGLEPPKRIRLAYLGRFLLENKTLGEQKVNEDHMLNGYVLQELAPPERDENLGAELGQNFGREPEEMSDGPSSE